MRRADKSRSINLTGLCKAAIPALCCVLCSAGCGSEFELLLDKNSGVEMKIFWSELSGNIKKTDTLNTEEATIVTTVGTPIDIDLDYLGGMLYWAERTADTHEIRRAGLEGDAQEVLYSAPSPFYGPTEIAVDPDSGLIYWNKFQTVSMTSTICSAAVSALTDDNCSNDLAYDYTSGIALHPESGELYFSANTAYWDTVTNAAAGTGSTGVLYRSSSNIPDLTAYIDLLPATGPEDPSVPLRGIAVDLQSASGYLFFVIDSNTESGAQIIRSDFDFTNQAVWVAAGSFDIHRIAIDRGERKIYWTSPVDNGIYRADADTANTGVELFLQGGSAPTGIAVGD